MNTYRLHLRSDEFQYEQEVHATDVEKDGWTVFWSGDDVFMRIRNDEIVSLEHVMSESGLWSQSVGTSPGPRRRRWRDLSV